MPLMLDEHNRRRIASVIMVQPPESQHDIVAFQRYHHEIARVTGLGADVLTTLESLAMLAEQGNQVAAMLYTSECARLGITFPRRFGYRPV